MREDPGTNYNKITDADTQWTVLTRCILNRKRSFDPYILPLRRSCAPSAVDVLWFYYNLLLFGSHLVTQIP